MAEESCQFYRIARKEAPASYIYEDERAIAFLDIRPLNDGHTLVISREQHETIFDVSGEEVAQLFEIVKKVAAAVKRGVGAEGITISQHNGRAAGQDVFHLRSRNPHV
jgi:histidine triad (HIT) family protein